MSEIGLVRVVAILLVTFYHLSFLEDGRLGAFASFLDFWGNVGNFLFFIVSGYALRPSSNIRFKCWISRRYFKIFPSVWIFYAICWLVGIYETYSFEEILLLKNYWFLNAIIFFYPVYYFCICFFTSRIVLCYVCICVLYVVTFFAQAHDAYIMQSGDYFIQWYPYFLAMLLGANISQKAYASCQKRCAYFFFLVLSESLHGWLLDYAMVFSNERWLQLLSPLLTCFSATFAFRLICFFSAYIPCCASKILNFISFKTLEIYVVQFVVIAFFMNQHFFGRLCIAMLSIFVMATLLQVIKKYTLVMVKFVLRRGLNGCA